MDVPTQQEQIDKRLKDMPRAYRIRYKKAMGGRSLKCAAQAFCLECVCWQPSEVKVCTDKGCPLYPYRPYQEIPWKAFRGKPPTKGFRKKNKNNVGVAEKPSESTESVEPMELYPPEANSP